MTSLIPGWVLFGMNRGPCSGIRPGGIQTCSAREALRTKRSVRELALGRGLLTAQKPSALPDPATMTCIRA